MVKTTGSRRRAAVLNLLEHAGIVSNADLTDRFGVTEMTIRRDLDALQAEGRIQRTHGGAVLVRDQVEPEFLAKQRTNAEQKRRIARYAAEVLTGDGEVLLMEGGSTVTAMAPFLADKRNLTVATNGLYTTNALAKLVPEVAVTSCGGMLRDVSYTFVGPSTVAFLRGFHADKLFLSTTGLSIEHGFTDPNPLEAEVCGAMVAASKQVIALVDSSKFDVVSAIKVMAVDAIDILVTDAETDLTGGLRRAGVDVRVV